LPAEIIELVPPGSLAVKETLAPRETATLRANRRETEAAFLRERALLVEYKGSHCLVNPTEVADRVTAGLLVFIGS
jgi:hypothetical protein